MLQGKKILLGVTGGIAAYKIPLLVRLLVKAGAEVKVVLSDSAKDFVSKKTLSVLSNNQVLDSFYSEEETWNNHVDLGIWADLFVVAPLTANTLAKMANGICDSLMLACYLSLRSKAMVFPAMDLDMWEHKSVQENIEKLSNQGIAVVSPESGPLASGLEGKGRMPEPESIFQSILAYFIGKETWRGKKVLLTAGPTHEAIDPVRYIGNHSSGKMGANIALTLANKGAKVFLVLGPTNIAVNHPNISVIPVKSALEMLEACEKEFFEVDVAIFCAAVADYRIKNPSDKKIKRENSGDISLELTQNPDIAATLSKQKKQQVCVGFALETNDALENASKKLQRKNLDMIVLNQLHKGEKNTFGSDFNQVTILSKDNKEFVSEFKSKTEIANDIEKCIYEWYFN